MYYRVQPQSLQEPESDRPYRSKRSLLLFSSFILGLSFWTSSPSRASSSTVQFERIGPFGGDARSLLISSANPDRVFLGTADGQVFESTDGGRSWAILYPGIGRRQYAVDTLLQHPMQPNYLYAGAWDLRSSGGGLFESSDSGATWKEIALPAQSPAVRDLAICRGSPGRMIVGTLQGVYVTENGGNSWRKVGEASPGFRNVESVAIDPRDPRILYVGTWHLGYRSVDFGKSWTPMGTGMVFDSDIFSMSVDAKNPEIIFASACTGIYRSSKRAAFWTRLKILPKSYLVRARVVYLDPVNPHRIYGGTTEGLFVSSDDGKSWKRLTAPSLTVNAVQVDPRNNKRILMGTDDEGVLRSEDGGLTWSPSNTGFVCRQISKIISDPTAQGRFFTGILSDGLQGGYFLYDNHASRWTPETSEIVARVPEVLSFLPLPRQKGRLAGTVQGVYWQKSPSSSWTKLTGEISKRAVQDLALDIDHSWVFAGTNDGIYRASLDNLEFQRPPSSTFRHRVFSIVIARGSPCVIYAGTHLGFLRSRDEGENWRNASVGLPNRVLVESVAADPISRDHLFVGTPLGLFESKDGGNLWERPRDTRLGVEVPSVIFLGPTGKRVMAADKSFGGVFLSQDGGESWEKIQEPGFGSPVRYLSVDPANPSTVYLGTNSEGVYRLRFTSAP